MMRPWLVRLSALRLPSFMAEAMRVLDFLQSSGAAAPRERICVASSPVNTLRGAGRQTPSFRFMQPVRPSGRGYDAPNALKVMMVRVSATPGMVCTFSAMKWPISTAGDFDLLVKFYVEQGTDIGHFIAQKVQTVPGVQDTRTIITFKAFGVA